MNPIARTLFISCTLITILSACTSPSDSTNSTVFHDPPLSTILPDPSSLFPDAQWIITDPDDEISYQFCLLNGTVEMFNTYLQAVKNAGFTSHATLVPDQFYQAFTEDNQFRVMVNYVESTDETVTYVYGAVWIVQQPEPEKEVGTP